MNLLDRIVHIWKAEHPTEVLPEPKGLNRRSFLKIMAGSAAVAAAVPFLDLEKLVWTPEAQIVVPRVVPAFGIGDVFTIQGLNSAHPITRQATGLEQQFVITNVISSTRDIHYQVQPNMGLDGSLNSYRTAQGIRQRDLKPIAHQLGSVRKVEPWTPPVKRARWDDWE